MRFIVDNNVGRLAVWLRALGYDTAYIDPIADGDLVEIARREGRVILSKDTGIFRRRLIASGEVQALHVLGDDWRLQLAQVVRRLGLRTEPHFTRCLECNTPLEPRTREEARPHVPPYVHATQESFLYCPGCGRHYWQGTHWQRMNESLARILTPETAPDQGSSR
jgi:uncharacterized protein with PIN domain